jgi:3D (Asp-Asp-Asp) domain-containing protein
MGLSMGKNYSFMSLVGSCLIIFLTVSLIIAKLSHEFPQRKKIYLHELLESEIFESRKKISLDSEITAYCPGSCCNSGIFNKNGRKVLIDWSDQVAVGQLSIRKLHKNGIAIAAVDPSVIPFGSIIRYGDKLYIALDSGRLIRETMIDISVQTHEEALRFGRRFNQNIIVFIPIDSESVVNEIKKSLGESSSAFNEKVFPYDSKPSNNLTSSAK